jgi:hypothetical protein
MQRGPLPPHGRRGRQQAVSCFTCRLPLPVWCTCRCQCSCRQGLFGWQQPSYHLPAASAWVVHLPLPGFMHTGAEAMHTLLRS